MDYLKTTVDRFLSRWEPWSTPALTEMGLTPDDCDDNPLMFQFFTWESKGKETLSWWSHLEAEIPRLKDLGVTLVWIPPAHKAAKKTGAGYDAYDLWDLGEFNQKGTIATRWGTKDELKKACTAANANGIGMLIDAVLGHKLGADRKETFQAIPVHAENRLRTIGPVREIEGWTAYDFSGRGETYSSMKWNHTHFTGIDWDSRTRTSQIYYIPDPGRRGWSKYVDTELGNYDYLLGCDIDHTQEDVREDLLRWGPWVLEQTGAFGFRFDAIKHFDRRFLLDFIKRCQSDGTSKRLFSVSEYWSQDISLLEPFVKVFQGQTAFFDVPLHYNLHKASRPGSEFDLRKIFRGSLLERRPWDAVTFVDNHDTGVGRTLESWVDYRFKLQAYALILLNPVGLPCVYYGDLYPNPEHYDATVAKKLELLILARKRFAYGPITPCIASRTCVGFVRAGDSKHAGSGCAVVLSSAFELALERRDDQSRPDERKQEIRMKVSLPSQTSGSTTYRDFLGGSGSVTVSSRGWGTFHCPSGGVAVWVRDQED